MWHLTRTARIQAAGKDEEDQSTELADTPNVF